MVKSAKRRVKGKQAKRRPGRIKAKAKRVAKAQVKAIKRKRPMPGAGVQTLAMPVAEHGAPTEELITSGLAPDEEIHQLDALDDSDRRADEDADDIDGGQGF